MNKIRALVLIVIITVAAVSCGKKGPPTLPPEPKDAVKIITNIKL